MFGSGNAEMLALIKTHSSVIPNREDDEEPHMRAILQQGRLCGRRTLGEVPRLRSG
jgi:hypothetical protein